MPLEPPERCDAADDTEEENVALEVAKYVCKVLNAVGLKNGPTHTEVKVPVGGALNPGPAIVEVNARWHAINFEPLVKACIGPSADAVEATVLALLAGNQGDHADDTFGIGAAAVACWEEIPWRYSRLQQRGRVVHLVSSVSGALARVDHLARIQALESVEAIELSVSPGDQLVPTIDISATDCGTIRLVHHDRGVLERDYDLIVSLMPSMFLVKVDADNGRKS
jgi:hypothetical protein